MQVLQVRLTNLLLLFGCCLVFSCGIGEIHEEFVGESKAKQKIQDAEQPSQHVLDSLLTLDAGKGLVYFKSNPFTGFAVSFYNPDVFKAKTEYVKGKKHGSIKKWFPDGSISYEAQYLDGDQHGKATSWWKNGNKRSETNYENGIAEGAQMQWYKSGAKFKHITLLNGIEHGMQQSWRENGKIYNNYEARNGRNFGLKRAKLCYSLDDEVVQVKQ